MSKGPGSGPTRARTCRCWSRARWWPLPASQTRGRRMPRSGRRSWRQRWGGDPGDGERGGGSVRVKGSPDRGIPLAAVAVLSNPMRYAFGGGTEAATQFAAKPRPGPPLPDGEQPGLEATGYFSPIGSAWAAGCHAPYVRVDPKTFRLEILKYVVVHDCGRLINPLGVEGQIEVCVAQGPRGAF